MSKTKILPIIILLFIMLGSYAIAYRPEPYTAAHSVDDVVNITRSSCSPPGDVRGCSACNYDYEQDCIFYFAVTPRDCKLAYSSDVDVDGCVSFVFHSKIADGGQISETCNLMSTKTNKNMCIWSLAVGYGELKQCDDIDTDEELYKGYRENCYEDYAKEKKDATQGCTKLANMPRAIGCCMMANYPEITEQYITSRQDLIDSYNAKYGTQLKACKQIIGVKGPAVVDSCEDLNCECLKECNKKTGEEQNKCAQACSAVYMGCYDKEKTEMVQESNDRYMQQSFYGLFSRKHCDEYKGSLSAALKKDDHGQKDEPAECSSHDECNEKRLCDACGRCRDEKELVPAAQVRMTYEVDPQDTEAKIKNIINENAVFRVTVSPIFEDTKTSRKIEYCDMVSPGIIKDVKLIATMNGEEEMSFAGFTTGSLLDARESSAACTIDIKEREKNCAFIVSPNDRKKPVGLVKEVVQYIDLGIVEDDKTYAFSTGQEVAGLGEAVLRLILEPSGPKLNYRMGSLQMQQGTTRAIKFTVDDPDTKIVMINAKTIGPATLFMPEDGPNLDLRSLHFTTEPKEDVQVGIKAPELGNFDIGKEINSLSMVDLQTEAGKQILTDAAFAAVDVGLDKVGENVKAVSDQEKNALEAYKKYVKNNPGYRSGEKTAQFVINAQKGAQYEKDVANLINLYKFDKGIINDLPGVHSGIKGSTQDVSVNVAQSDPDSSATTTETAANIGVTAINLAQLGVSVLTLVPNKIPGVGKMTAGFQVAFSAATNIWKANLKYIAQAEKIDRAKEVFIPVLVVVTAEDMSGWQTQSAIVMKIAYHQV